MLEGILRRLATSAALGPLAGVEWSPTLFGGYVHEDRPVFLPASRTGFMLLYKDAVRAQIGGLERFREREAQPDLTTPAVRFLELLAVGLQSRLGPYADEAAFLEQHMAGHVELSAKVGVNDYHYRPAGSDARLTMALSSSLVTELAPIILVLRHLKDFPVLILEEPEAHLHPRMQRVLAQTIARLVRKGLHVWVTTHSENFCQQINNFLKIGCHPDRAGLQKQFGYEAQDYLELDDVAGYEFTIPEGHDRSIVTELHKNERGISMPTFNNELLRLSKEALFLQRKTSEQE